MASTGNINVNISVNPYIDMEALNRLLAPPKKVDCPICVTSAALASKHDESICETCWRLGNNKAYYAGWMEGLAPNNWELVYNERKSD